jgi:Ca-activated chloride channel homolog
MVPGAEHRLFCYLPDTSLMPENNATGVLLACSPEKATFFHRLRERLFSSNRPEPARLAASLEVVALDSEEIFNGVLRGSGDSPSLVLQQCVYARSPLLIGVLEEVARSWHYPAQPIGWSDLLQHARTDPNFHWSHLSPHCAAGLLTLAAAFHVGLGQHERLTLADLEQERAADFLRALEGTVKHYGESEEGAINSMLGEEGHFFHACVLQERSLLQLNRRVRQKKMAIVYPREGSFLLEHPLALLRTEGDDSPAACRQQRAFELLREAVLSPGPQQLLSREGYRPTDDTFADDFLSAVSESKTPFLGSYPIKLPTTLPTPTVPVLNGIRSLWRSTKRRANIFLVADTSASMAGEKLEGAKSGLREFVSQIDGDNDRLGFIEFGSSIKAKVTLRPASLVTPQLLSMFATLAADGNTALFDAVRDAYESLQTLAERPSINAIVAMTDGQENNSSTHPAAFLQQVQQQNKTGVPVVIFCVAYGADADRDVLRLLAHAAAGDVSPGDPASIRTLYRMLARRM